MPHDMGLFLKHRIRLIAVIFFILFSILFNRSTPAQEVRLSNIVVTNSQTDLLVYISVKGAFSPEIQQAIMSGVPTTFSFLITLNQVRSYWIDKEINDIRITHTIKYHNLKNEYVITRSWENDKPIMVESLKEAQQLMTQVDHARVAPLHELKKGKKYQLRAKAEFSKVTLPYYLHYILFFVSLWNFETDWYTIDFEY